MQDAKVSMRDLTILDHLTWLLVINLLFTLPANVNLEDGSVLLTSVRVSKVVGRAGLNFPSSQIRIQY